MIWKDGQNRAEKNESGLYKMRAVLPFKIKYSGLDLLGR